MTVTLPPVTDEEYAFLLRLLNADRRYFGPLRASLAAGLYVKLTEGVRQPVVEEKVAGKETIGTGV